MKKILLGAIAVLALAGIGIWQFSAPFKAAPDVTFTSLTGERITTRDLRGKVVLVKFWATSCVTCIAQMPDTIKYYNELSPKGFETIAVAMQYDPPNYVKNYAETRQLPFKVAIDAQGEIAKAFGDVRLTPTAFLIDKEGHIIKRYLGNYDKEAFLSIVNKALAS
ncbi:TlpA disulfide reductase family protein [Parapusillimonas granuli]|uniref:TlpA family protein disulfide reductase n=1 Tax=Parapusillimonas granuli TaxID=380911 RepID=A0A853FSJ9_9BURK|nr:TlpA disulfide reductase family protein [Parapusillimonas granuli]MBB5214757.1 peroxiredoxin [Parapusillimonas granuli]MEB2397995.1 TlpA disulfide reductase family protein [Alcaligenaceae bacterium]NYT48835.1 TlpA family protein disulfide reductase [Parapusillimonas granuli]